MGLNLGAQLFWQSRAFPGAFSRTGSIVTYPQYWSYRLSGVLASEITSLGCHTDLWNFQTDLYSSLVVRQGWLEKMPGVRLASDVLGPVRPELMTRFGLGRPIPVICGIHDSNASLLPHLLARKPPFAVVSTGTWVIVCAPGAELSELDPARDCLANIDAFGRPVASARFMGGREFSQLVGDEPVTPSAATVDEVLDDAILLLPSVVEGSGPFPRRKAQWSVPRETLDRETVFTATSFYLAMMTVECLNLSGAAGETVVEGPFASNRLYTEMLAAATARPVVAMEASATGTSVGAALLADIDHAKANQATVPAQPTSVRSAAMARYADLWRAAVSGR